MKQSAVDFLISHLQKSKDFQRVLTEVSQMSTAQFDLIKEANSMFEEQVKDAHLIGLITSMEMEATKQAEHYYNETYGGEK